MEESIVSKSRARWNAVCIKLGKNTLPEKKAVTAKPVKFEMPPEYAKMAAPKNFVVEVRKKRGIAATQEQVTR